MLTIKVLKSDKNDADIIYSCVFSPIGFWTLTFLSEAMFRIVGLDPVSLDQSAAAAGVNWASCPVSQANAGSGSYVNTSTSAACCPGISIPNVFEDRRECSYFGLITCSHRKLWLNKWILTRGICIQKHSGFGGSGWCAGPGLRRSVWISSFTACSL